jgi:hypothetical protein
VGCESACVLVVRISVPSLDSNSRNQSNANDEINFAELHPSIKQPIKARMAGVEEEQKSKRGPVAASFISSLYAMTMTPELQDLVSFSSDGNSFVIKVSTSFPPFLELVLRACAVVVNQA